MIFEKINYNHIKEVASIALAEYSEECSVVLELPRKDYTDLFCKMLSDMIENKLGVVALDQGKVVGFITCYGPMENFFGTVKGVFSPIHGHGAIKEDRELIYTMLYQYAAKIWVEQGIFSHAIAVYSHNQIAIDTYFRNGFGMRCVDAIISVNSNRMLYEAKTNTVMNEISINQIESILDLKNNLTLHMKNSPIFMPTQIFDSRKFREQSIKRNSRFFTANIEGRVIGYVEIMSSGENFTCDDEETMNICGAYIYPEYRGTGVYKNLLAYMIETIKNENYKRCGVDFESINPNADKFWLKYFTPYTYSMVRRIDERIL